MNRTIAVALFLAFTGMANAATLKEQEKQLDQFFTQIRSGLGDYWLTRRNNSGADERIGIVFGFVDNLEFCLEVARDQMKKYPQSRYDCERAN